MLADFLQLLGLCLLAGGPACHALTQRRWEGLSGRLVLGGGALFIAAAAVEWLWPGPPVAAASPPPFPWLLPLVVLYTLLVCLALRYRAVSLGGIAAVLALALITLKPVTADGGAGSGLLGLSADAIHRLAAVLWAGGLWYLVYRTWRHPPPGAADRGASLPGQPLARFTGLAVILLGLAAVSGFILALMHIHSTAAMDSTAYGQLFQVKLLLAGLLFVLLVTRLMRVSHVRAGRSPRPSLRGPGCLRLIESILLLAILFVSVLMASRPPPDTAPFLSARTWTLPGDPIPLQVDLQPVAGSSEAARLEMAAGEPAPALPTEAGVSFSLVQPGRGAGVPAARAIHVGGGDFLGEVLIPVPGDWRLRVDLALPDGTTQTTGTTIHIPPRPLAEDHVVYLSLDAIAYTGASRVTFTIGLLLILTTAWLFRRARQGRIPPWMIPASLSGMALGGYLVLSVALVNTYPSTYRDNPLPYSAEVIQRGNRLFQDQCAECHGSGGEGDGPWAIRQQGSIPSLTTAHMDVHTDGEIWWWVSRGIPELDMPALAGQITPRERWAVVHYVRSLRYGVPGDRGSE